MQGVVKMSANKPLHAYLTNEELHHLLPFGFIVLKQDSIVYANEKLKEYFSVTNMESYQLIIDDEVAHNVWKQRKVIHTIKYIEQNKYYCIYSPSVDNQGRMQCVTLIIIPFESFMEQVKQNTDYFPIMELIPLIADYSPDAVTYVLPDLNKTIHNKRWTTTFNKIKSEDKDAVNELNEILKNIINETVESRRSSVVNINIGKMRLSLQVTTKPIIISGKLYGCFQMIKNDEAFKYFEKKYEIAKKVIRNLEKTFTYTDIIGESFDLKLAINQAKLFSKMKVPILIKGEPGTGKEVFARAIHSDNKKNYLPFFRFDGRTDSTSLERLLIEILDESNVYNGTIYVKYVFDLNETILEKIMLCSKKTEITFIFSTDVIEMHKSHFYDWITKYIIYLPSLKDRKEDIPLIIKNYLEKMNEQYDLQLQTLDEEIIHLFNTYEWPKNIAELQNVMEYIGRIANPSTTVISTKMLPEYLNGEREETYELSNEKASLQTAMDEFEKKYIHNRLISNNYNKTKTAKELGISIRNLYYKMDKYNIDRGRS
jgi:transcriptional regulator with PAS, ATPase and Fis domain